MPWKGLSTGSSNPAVAVFAATTFSNSDGKLSSGTQRKGLWRVAGTTGLEPATSDVTGLRSGLATSMIYLCFQRLEGVTGRHGSP